MITFFDINVFIYALDRLEHSIKAIAANRIEVTTASRYVYLPNQVFQQFYNICNLVLSRRIPQHLL